MMKNIYIFKILISFSIIVCNCDDTSIAVPNNNNNNNNGLIQQFSIRIFNKGTLVSLIELLKGNNYLPLCSMVGCATNATQCQSYGGKEMVNKVSIENYTQAYFKSVFTLDKTFLSINCNNILVPCCFPKVPVRKPGLPELPDKSGLLSSVTSLIPSLPPMSVYLLSNICFGLAGGVGNMICNSD